jgi:hypothetical protein
MKNCPYCAEEIQDEAVICRFCNRKVKLKGLGAKKLKADFIAVWAVTIQKLRCLKISDIKYSIRTAVPSVRKFFDSRRNKTICGIGVLIGMVVLVANGFRGAGFRYYPIRVGMTWIYSTTASCQGATLTGTTKVSIIGEKDIDGEKYFVIEKIASAGGQELPAEYEFVRMTPEGVLQLDIDYSEYLLLASDLKVGHSWESKGAKQTIKNTVTDEGNLVVFGTEYSDCIKIVSESASVGNLSAEEVSYSSRTSYRAPEIGVIYESVQAKTSLGELTESTELTHFNGVQQIKPYMLSAIQLCNEYDSNEVAADSKFKHKVVVVTGQVKDFGTTDEGDPFIDIGGGAGIDCVRCYFTKAEKASLARFSKGQRVAVKGTVIQKYAGAVLVHACSLQDHRGGVFLK